MGFEANSARAKDNEHPFARATRCTKCNGSTPLMPAWNSFTNISTSLTRQFSFLDQSSQSGGRIARGSIAWSKCHNLWTRCDLHYIPATT